MSKAPGIQHSGSPLRSRPGIRVCRRDAVTVYVNKRLWPPENIDPLFRLPRIVEDLTGFTSRSADRITVWNWQPDRVPEPGLVVRKFVHGGLLRNLTGGWFWGTERMRNEMRLGLDAVERGVPTCRPVALRTEHAMGPFYTGYYVTERIPNSLNLRDLCRDIQEGRRLAPQSRRLIARQIAGAIADMHDAGLVHADLNLKNVLVRNPRIRPEAFVIDLDGAQMRQDVSLSHRLDNLVRLDRSVLKWPSSRKVITLQDRLRTWKVYLERYREWAPHWKKYLRNRATRHLRHALSRK